ncbi:MAG: hypothetical protein LUE86_05945, partial [Clostridiales bacterium]|nr:hypothetical protein [Clostridiales bacterium]
MKIGDNYEIFEKMSVGDNLLLPSLKKISCLEYLKSGRKITGILSAEMSDESFGQDVVVRDLNQNSHISVAFDRWYVFNPQVIVLYEPFSSCDDYVVSVITSYINKFYNRGTAV